MKKTHQRPFAPAHRSRYARDRPCSSPQGHKATRAMLADWHQYQDLRRPPAGRLQPPRRVPKDRGYGVCTIMARG